MAWNYRVFRTAYGGPHMEKQTEYWSIRDVYDREDGSIYALGGVAARLIDILRPLKQADSLNWPVMSHRESY